MSLEPLKGANRIAQGNALGPGPEIKKAFE
jgi:hypothetical protein